jgi:succinate dehydrogenase/fumarate reductase flavoprotein subunit
MLTLARLATAAALAREESRGTHHRSDFPEPRAEWLAHLSLRPQLGGGRIVATTLESERIGAPATRPGAGALPRR